MARYSNEHREETRRKVVEAASRAFRAGGLSEVSVPKLMAEAGLTHGGFYFHFDSKEALIAEACAAGMQETAAQMDEAATTAPEGRAVEAIIRRYLSPQHREVPEQGCVLPTLGGQLARHSDEVRAEFTLGLQEFLRVVTRHLGGAAEDEVSDEALVLVSSMAGAMLIARSVADRDMSDRTLDAARAFLVNAFGSSKDADA